MLIDTTLLANNPEIIKGLIDGSLVRYGSVIRNASGFPNAGQIVQHLAEAPNLTNSLLSIASNPVMGSVNAGVNAIGHTVTVNQLMGLNTKVSAMQQTLSQVMGLTQIAAGASVLTLGVSVAGFAYMGYKLHQMQKSINKLQETMERGFNDVNSRLDDISGQLAYLYLLVQDSREKQENLGKAISNIHKAMLIKEISTLQAELEVLRLFPNESPLSAIKTATNTRLFLSSQAMQSTPELEAELLLNSDVSIQGWAVATVTEAHLLLQMGQHQEAKGMLREEVEKFKTVAHNWSNSLIKEGNSSLSTAYRFSASPFAEYITPERVTRIKDIYPSDLSLNQDQVRRKKNEASVEFEMSYAQERYPKSWIQKQIAIAEYLDGLSELLARLESLEAFADLCESRNLKSSKEILPDENAPSELYLLPAD
ncbi:hypothetical protein WEU38_14930 [Cyanobacterium aponinum AL20118]|uniref:Uncharacterized protein n=1 Tax=Cyanobacterium aponinum AL20115 TaxID=3090662 RepID=A0AAF1C525_9CHRO|nr:hypothetical protein [Cyanobacterium aponinum]WPF88091.1 hypothetical protein SAY89_15000 [Cyanobacterium aponinum AL20115]